MEPVKLELYLSVFCALLFLAVLSPTEHYYAFLQVERAIVYVRGIRYRLTIGTSLWLTRQSFRRGPMARILRELELQSIRRNPAYSEFFQEASNVEGSKRAADGEH